VNSGIPTYESVYLHAFEGVPIRSLAIYLMNTMHPGGWLVGRDSEVPKKTRKEKKKEKRKKEEKGGKGGQKMLKE
jgi:hypothetical protein